MGARLINRAERLAAIERLLFRHSIGLRAVEIAEACGVDRRTIYRDLSLLDNIGVPISQQDGRFFINKEYYLASVRLNSNEALVLFLAARLLSRQAEQQNPHLVSALTKLSSALPESMAQHVNYIAEFIRANPVDRNFVQILETVARGWAERRKVKIWGSPVKNGEIRAHDFCTYFIEPTASGELYAIGFDELNEGIRAFKLEAVKRAKLLDNTYTIPHNFDRRSYFASLWGGIAGAEGEGKTRVVLAFSADVTPLIKERIGLTSQRLETLADKRCTLTLQVSDWQSLLPWIRSWGAQVEVMEPQALREELSAEVLRLATLYSTAVRS